MLISITPWVVTSKAVIARLLFVSRPKARFPSKRNARNARNAIVRKVRKKRNKRNKITRAKTLRKTGFHSNATHASASQ